MARNEPAVGISIDNGVLRALAVDSATGEPIVGTVTPRGGTLPDSLRDSIRSVRVRPGAVATAFGLDRATVRRMTLPQTSGGNIDRMVRFEAERYIPLPVEAVELDFHAIVDRGADRLDVVVAAVRKNEAVQLSTALLGATSGTTVVDTTATALLAAWQQAREGVSEAALIADLSGEHASIAVCESGNLVLARSVASGVETLRTALAEDLQISAPEAEEVRQSNGVTGLDAGPPPVGLPDEPIDRERATEWLARLAQEIRRTLESFRSQRGGMQRCTVEITGEGADTPGLREALEDAIGMDIGLFDPLAEASIELPGPGHEFTIAYGLALRAAGRSPVEIDLSPKAERADRERRRHVTGIVAAIAAAVIVLGGAYWYANSQLVKLEASAKSTATQVADLEATVGDLDQALADAAAVSDVEDLLIALDDPTSRPLEMLHGVSVSMPGGVWLTDFLYDRTRGVSVHDHALDAVAVTEAVRVLSRKPHFSEVKLSSLNVVTIGDQPVYEFDITGDFPEPEGS